MNRESDGNSSPDFKCVLNSIPLLGREDAIFVISTMELDRYTDQEIAQAILRRDTFITKAYLYRKCYPLFKAIYDKYYTDCENPIELINEIYVYTMIR